MPRLGGFELGASVFQTCGAYAESPRGPLIKKYIGPRVPLRDL